MTQPLAQAVLTPEDQAFFDQQGYLLVEDALPARRTRRAQRGH